MRGRDWLESLSGGPGGSPEPEWLDVLVRVLDEHPGKGEAAKYLAEETGVHVRSAQRWLKLDHMPTGAGAAGAERLREELAEEQAEQSEADRRHETAELLRAMTSLTPGVVKVRNKSDRKRAEFRRNIKQLTQMGPGLARVADAWEDGDDEEAEDALSDAIMGRYQDDYKGRSDDTEGLASYLEIVNYTEGIDYA